MMTVRSLKGAPVSILIALIVAHTQLGRSSLSAKELQDWTGYANEKVTAGARLLMGSAMIVKARVGWALAEGMQFVLPGLDGLSLAESDLIGLPASTTTYFHEQNEAQPVEVVRTSPIKSDSFDLLVALGVGRSMAETLAALEWATVDYLRAHAAPMDLPDNIGLFITRVRDGDPAPKGRQVVTVTSQVDAFLRVRK